MLQYIESLREANAGKKKKAAAISGNKGKKKSSYKRINLDASSDAEDDKSESDEMPLSEKERFYRLLTAQAHGCQICGPSALCKIGYDGKHKTLTLQQIQGWATALSLNAEGVSLKIPPNDSYYADFHDPRTQPGSTPIKSKYGQ
jgi:hypothetical protein